jgi:acyl-CoA thioester hydrolase
MQYIRDASRIHRVSIAYPSRIHPLIHQPHTPAPTIYLPKINTINIYKSPPLTITPYTPEIRFNDIDAMGHVNNAIYFTYFEQSRIHFFRQIIQEKWDWNKHDILVAHNEIDYYKPILLNDKVEIFISCAHIGEKSFTIGYNVKVGDQLYSRGKSVLVCFDYTIQKTTSIPEQWLPMLNQLLIPVQ